jgi:hypothetical protein
MQRLFAELPQLSKTMSPICTPNDFMLQFYNKGDIIALGNKSFWSDNEASQAGWRT